MSSAASTATAGFTPGKIGLIALLAIVLVGTVVYQFLETSGSPRTYTKRASRSSDEAAPASSSAPASDTRATVLRAIGGKWPQISVVEASRFDPFAFPEWMASRSANPRTSLQPLQIGSSGQSTNPDSTELSGGKTSPSSNGLLAESRPQEMKRRLEEQQAVAAELQRRGVGIVYQTSQGSVARLGDLEVRVGDVLNGLRVVEINADGIRLVSEDAIHGRRAE